MTAAPAFPSLLTLRLQGWEGLPQLADHATSSLEPPAGCCVPCLSVPTASGSCQTRNTDTSILPQQNLGSVSRDAQGLWSTEQAWLFPLSPETWGPLWDQ